MGREVSELGLFGLEKRKSQGGGCVRGANRVCRKIIRKTNPSPKRKYMAGDCGHKVEKYVLTEGSQMDHVAQRGSCSLHP